MTSLSNELSAGQRGFSLLELLVALVIIGLVISLAGISVSSGSRPYEIEAALNEFMDVIQYAQDEGQFRGVDLGVYLEEDLSRGRAAYNYIWLERIDLNEWRPAAMDPDVFGVRELPEGVEVALEVEEGAIVLEEEFGETDEEELLRPQVVFFSSGETTPGIMTWVDSETREVLWELEWDLIGRLSKRRRGVADEEDEYAR